MCVKQEHRIINKWNSIQASAHSRGKEFNLTLLSVRNLLSAKKCYYTGRPLTEKNISIDRIDNTKGYVIGNVCACDIEVNNLKNSLSKKDIEKILKNM